jgi:hypothetical protein
MITGSPESKFRGVGEGKGGDAFRLLRSHTSALESRRPRISLSRCQPICLTNFSRFATDNDELHSALSTEHPAPPAQYLAERESNDHARAIMLARCCGRPVCVVTPSQASLCFAPYLHLSGEQVGYASLQWLSSPCPITTQKCPGNASSNFRQNQRQRIRKSERLFISPDFLLTSHPSKDGMSPTSNLQVIMSSQSSQPFRDIRKYLQDYLRHQLRKEWQLSPTLPVGLTPDQNQERPEAIHAGGSCSGIADA